MKYHKCAACGFELETDSEESFKVVDKITFCAECIVDLDIPLDSEIQTFGLAVFVWDSYEQNR